MYDNNKSFSNNRNNNYPNKNFDNKTMFTAEFIKKGFRNDKGKLRPDLFSDEAKNIAVKNTKYLLTLSDGSTLEGITDDKGYTETALSSKQLNINSIEFIEDEN